MCARELPKACQGAEGEGGGVRSPLKVSQLQSLREAFREVLDPRSATSRRHPLPAMLGLIALGLLMGARDVLDLWRKVACLSQNQRQAPYALTCLEKCLLPLQEKIFLRLAPARWFRQANGDSFPVLEHLFEGKPRAYRLDHLAKGKGKFPPAARVPRLPASCIPRGKVRAPGLEPCRSTTPQTACRRAML